MSDLVLVHRFEELTPGVRIRVKRCEVCGDDHEGMIAGGPRIALVGWPGDDETHEEEIVPFVPRPRCMSRSDSAGACIGRIEVVRQVVWRYVDLDPKTESETKPERMPAPRKLKPAHIPVG